MNETKRKVIAAILWIALILLISAVVRSIAKPSKQGNGNNASQEQAEQEPVELDSQDTRKVKPYGYDKPPLHDLMLNNDPVSDEVFWNSEWVEGGNGPDLQLKLNYKGEQTMRFKPVVGTSGEWTWTGWEKVPGILPGFPETRRFERSGRIEVVGVDLATSKVTIKTYKFDEVNPELEIPHVSGILYAKWSPRK